jgi:hypothetical protein
MAQRERTHRLPPRPNRSQLDGPLPGKQISRQRDRCQFDQRVSQTAAAPQGLLHDSWTVLVTPVVRLAKACAAREVGTWIEESHNLRRHYPAMRLISPLSSNCNTQTRPRIFTWPYIPVSIDLGERHTVRPVMSIDPGPSHSHRRSLSCQSCCVGTRRVREWSYSDCSDSRNSKSSVNG